MAGSQSLVCITDTFTFTTSATTTTATPGLVVATVSPLVSFPVATQESVAGPSCSFSGGSFYSTCQRTLVLAKRARVEPPPKDPRNYEQGSLSLSLYGTGRRETLGTRLGRLWQRW